MAVAAELRVVATAGHVDHGKSSLIRQLTGIDPDRWDEEKRRGLTIDLGYAWCTLPSGREIGFVDVPGHERFVRNMLAGVGPVRLVMFVVAADEGWRPQSEEHLQILDVLGVAGGVIALTKRDLVDSAGLDAARRRIEERVAGTGLEGAPIVAVSGRTGEGVDDLRSALDAMVRAAPVPEPTRTRLFVDRVFTITGAGTVVTGTLTGACLENGDAVALLPGGIEARIRSLQTHEHPVERACPVSRVAANLVGPARDELARGDVLGSPGAWRPTDLFEASLRPVRGLGRALGSRGAYSLHAGSSETDVRIRIYGEDSVEPGGEAFVRIRADRPIVLDVFDRFVVRDAGRRETVAGGIVLDVAPPARAGRDPERRVAARASAERETLPHLLTEERGAVSAADARILTGSSAEGGVRVGGWFVRAEVVDAITGAVSDRLGWHHRERPLEPGAPLTDVREAIADVVRQRRIAPDPALVDALLRDLGDHAIVLDGGFARLASHEAAKASTGPDVERLLDAIGGDRSTSPPSVDELVVRGIPRAVIEAAARSGAVVQVAPELVFTPEAVARAREVAASAAGGITVSAFREALGTSRKFALPLLAYFDRTGVTRREGDLRFPTRRD
jgi:selenocysteine-specific elongation factor